jgi:hypothetical protein
MKPEKVLEVIEKYRRYFEEKGIGKIDYPHDQLLDRSPWSRTLSWHARQDGRICRARKNGQGLPLARFHSGSSFRIPSPFS